jgi:hypothetical protein
MKRLWEMQLLRWMMVLLLLFAVMPSLSAPAKVLKGTVEEENLRINQHRNPGSATALRIQRGPARASGSLVDSSAFAPPETPGSAPMQGVVDASDFSKLPPNFDIGAERQSREMVLAWERWHHQLAQAIYERWQRIARDGGRATVKVTVTNDRHIRAQVLQPSGNPDFDGCIIEAVSSLESNPGLSFPTKSQRRVVSFEADYIAGSNVRPGFTWRKDDYERVREDR